MIKESQKGAVDLAAVIVVVLVAIILAGVGYVIYNSKQGEIAVEQSELPVFTADVDEPFDILYHLDGFLEEKTGITLDQSDQGLFWRVSTGGPNQTDYVTINGLENPFATQHVTHLAASTKPALKQILNTIDKTLQLEPLASRIFERNGFVLNNLNTYTDHENVYRVKSYEKDKIKCSILEREEEEVAMTVIFSCGELNEKSQAYQEEFSILKDLYGADQAYRDVVIGGDITRVGDFLRLSIGGASFFGGGGHYEIVKFEEGRYKSILAGQDTQPCTAVDEYKVPKEIYGNCFEGEVDNAKERFEEDQYYKYLDSQKK